MADLRQLAQSILQVPGKVGQWGSENFIYDPKTKTPLPGGFVGASSRASKLPMGSKEQINEYIKMAMMAGLTGPIGKASLIKPIDPVPSNIQTLTPMLPKSAGINPDDMDVMEKVMDYARLKQPYSHSTEQMAGDLMERYPMKTRGSQPKNMSEVANVFQKALETLINKK